MKESKELNELFDLDESYDFESEFDEQTEESFNEWKCDNCSETFNSSRKLKTHVKKEHSKALSNSEAKHDKALYSHLQKSCEI